MLNKIILFLILFDIASANYTPLSGIPLFRVENDMSVYINYIYNVLILFGSVVSVMIIAYSGLRYMTSDIPKLKTNSKEKIIKALLGLIMLLGAHLILRFINPELVELKLLNR